MYPVLKKWWNFFIHQRLWFKEKWGLKVSNTILSETLEANRPLCAVFNTFEPHSSSRVQAIFWITTRSNFVWSSVYHFWWITDAKGIQMCWWLFLEDSKQKLALKIKRLDDLIKKTGGSDMPSTTYCMIPDKFLLYLDRKRVQIALRHGRARRTSINRSKNWDLITCKKYRIFIYKKLHRTLRKICD